MRPADAGRDDALRLERGGHVRVGERGERERRRRGRGRGGDPVRADVRDGERRWERVRELVLLIPPDEVCLRSGREHVSYEMKAYTGVAARVD